MTYRSVRYDVEKIIETIPVGECFLSEYVYARIDNREATRGAVSNFVKASKMVERTEFKDGNARIWRRI